MLSPVRRRSLSDAVFEQLRDRIMAGDMEPGTALPAERVLAEMLNVNRGAIREALKRLEQARLVSIQHGGTTRVADFMETAGLDLLAEMMFAPDGTVRTHVARSVIEMRSCLAPDIARLAAERASDDVKRRLAALIEQMEAAVDDLPKLQRMAMAFWLLAVEGSGNVAYRLAVNTLHQTYEKLLDLLAEVLREELTDVPAYRAIARAIQRGDTAKAERRARELTEKGAERLLEIIEALRRMEES